MIHLDSKLINKSPLSRVETDFPDACNNEEDCRKKPVCDGQLKVMPKVGATGSENSR